MTATLRKPVTSDELDRIHGVDSVKLPPHSIECEQSVLGALLLENQAWDLVADTLSEADFYRADHRLLWRAIARLISDSKPADAITVAESLESTRELDSVGGMSYIAALADNTPSSANISHYAGIVRDRAVLRRLAATCSAILDRVYAPAGMETAQILDQAQQRILSVAEGAQSSAGFEPVFGAMKRAIDGMGKMGMPTGFTDLDGMTGGFGAGDLVVVAGRPSMGKTAFTMCIAEWVALDVKKPVGVFSLEMPSEALASRLLTSFARVNHFKFRKDALNPDESRRISDSLSALSDMPLYIDETGAISPAEVRARCRRLSRERGQLGLVIVDYLQLMDVDALGDSRADSVGRASRELKHLAKEMQCPVVVLSQLNRQVEQRPNKRPNMADLRDSGAIEQDADLILFLYRDEVYNPESADKGSAELIVAKQRNGPIGMVRLEWNGNHMRFGNFAGKGRA